MSIETKIPKHVAIIMDGNGRWAKQHGKDRSYGHIMGVESVRAVVKAAIRNSVKYLTLYTFSTENWGRPTSEIDALMELLCSSIVNETPELKSQGVALRVIGDRASMSDKVQEHLSLIEEQTKECSNLTLILALNYSARWEITQMVRSIVQKATQGEIDLDQVDAKMIEANLCTNSIPDPDLLIRTSGECRLSNFLLWQLAYSEIYFTDVYWPDFDQAQFDKALEAYAKRDRRFGLIKK